MRQRNRDKKASKEGRKKENIRDEEEEKGQKGKMTRKDKKWKREGKSEIAGLTTTRKTKGFSTIHEEYCDR